MFTSMKLSPVNKMNKYITPPPKFPQAPLDSFFAAPSLNFYLINLILLSSITKETGHISKLYMSINYLKRNHRTITQVKKWNISNTPEAPLSSYQPTLFLMVTIIFQCKLVLLGQSHKIFWCFYSIQKWNCCFTEHGWVDSNKPFSKLALPICTDTGSVCQFQQLNMFANFWI